MKLPSRPKIALCIESSRSYGRGLLRGVAAFARTRTNWSLLHYEMTIDSAVPDWIDEAGVDGIIARINSQNIEPIRRRQVPVVDVRCQAAYSDIQGVDTDDCLVADKAFEHLADRGFRRFAYCGFRFAHYSTARLRFFRACVKNADFHLDVYESPGPRHATLSTLEQAGQFDVQPLANWLHSLVPPVGLFVCNDIRGRQVLNVCRSIGLAVPDDLAVVGVDDDETLCLLSDPPLSSIQPDTERIGYRAAEILDQAMNGGFEVNAIELIPPLGVVQRASTQVEAVTDRKLAGILRYIREHACERINVHDVVRVSSISRRALERLFREQVGRTPREAITAVQIERVKTLLKETDWTVEQIAAVTGYSHTETLSAVFKRETGLSPGKFRLQNR